MWNSAGIVRTSVCGFNVNEKCSDTINDIATSDHEMQVYIVCVRAIAHVFVHVCVYVYLSLMYFPVNVNKFYTVLRTAGVSTTIIGTPFDSAN